MMELSHAKDVKKISDVKHMENIENRNERLWNHLISEITRFSSAGASICYFFKSEMPEPNIFEDKMKEMGYSISFHNNLLGKKCFGISWKDA